MANGAGIKEIRCIIFQAVYLCVDRTNGGRGCEARGGNFLYDRAAVLLFCTAREAGMGDCKREMLGELQRDCEYFK